MSIYKDFVAEYLKGISPKEPAVAEEMREFAINNNIPTMTALEGRFLQLLVTWTRSNNILEMGTGIGYSSFWMGSVNNVSKLITIEYNADYSEKARNYLNQANLGKIAIIEGNTQDILPQINGLFDLIFMDHYKDYYVPDLEAGLKLLKKGGVFVAHNALEGGWATGYAEDDLKSDKLKKFHEAFLGHPELDAMILPVGEGFAFGIKR